jgi:hypothetical protein
MLLRHQIEVYALNTNLSSDGINFTKGNAYVVPANQPQVRLIHGIFDKTLKYQDSLFYDITAWTMPLAFGLDYAELNATVFNNKLLSNPITSATAPVARIPAAKSDYAYLLDWNELLAPKALYALQEAGVTVRVATVPFEIETDQVIRKFSYGTLTIPVALQRQTPEQLFDLVKSIGTKNSVTVYSVKTGNVVSGSDLGSSKMMVAGRPNIAMIVGAGVNPTDAGEVWHLLDQRMNIPSTHLEQGTFNRIDP